LNKKKKIIKKNLKNNLKKIISKENEIYYFGSNSKYESGNGDNKQLTSIIKLNYFQNENKKIKKIACGCDHRGFNLFLTGCNFKN
jgi:alpha-tubulin suppressor-like RCC1 family protein